MYSDLGFFMGVKSAFDHERRSGRPGVAIIGASGEEDREETRSDVDDLERVEMFIVRAALGAINAVMKMLNLVAFPLLLCIEGRLQYYGLFLAQYELLYFVNGCILIPLVERYSKGAEAIRYFAVVCELVAWLLYLIILGSEGNFELLWLLQIFFGFSSLLQLQVLSIETSENFECSDIDCGGITTSDGIYREILASDMGLLHYLTVLGPAVGILASISVRLEDGEVSSTVRGLIPVGVLGVSLAFVSLLGAIYLSFGFPRPPLSDATSSNGDDPSGYLVAESERNQRPPSATIATVGALSESRAASVGMRSRDGRGWERCLLNFSLFLFFFAFDGSLWTIFAYNYLSSSRLVNIYSPFLIGAAVAYASQLECWCWNDQRFVSSISRYQCFTPHKRGYIISQLGSSALLVSSALQLVTVGIVFPPSSGLDGGTLLRPAVFALCFLLGLSGALFCPSVQKALINMDAGAGAAGAGAAGEGFAIVAREQEHEHEHEHERGQGPGLMATYKGNLRSLSLVAAGGRLCGVLFSGTITGVSCSRGAPTCTLSPASDPTLMYLLTGTGAAASLAVLVLLALIISGRLSPVPSSSPSSSFDDPYQAPEVAGRQLEVSAARILFRDTTCSGDGGGGVVVSVHEHAPPRSPRIPAPGHLQLEARV